MELGYDISIELRQSLSQNQIQSLEILSMDGAELSAFLQNEYLENPLLDCSGSHDSSTEDLNKTYEHAVTYGRTYEEMIEEEDKRRKDIPVEEDKVKSYLLYQLPIDQFSGEEWSLMEYMVECLEDTGFFTVSADEVASQTGMPVETVERLLSLLRQLEPCGIFASDLKHCLLRQLEVQGLKDSPVWMVVERHLKDVATGKISSISRSLKLSTAEVRKCINQIARLNPRPMGGIGGGSTHYIVPDVIFRMEDGKWEVQLNDDWLEDYRVNDYYLKMMNESKDEELTEYFRSKLERVRFVLRSIAQRRQTLLTISEQILERQKGYLEGREYLKPMTMTELAEQIGIHASTVSRAVRGKYIQYPRGTVTMKSMFSSPVSKKDKEAGASVMQIKGVLRELIDGEDKKKPYSDQALLELLKEKKIEISRRAVAKYREELGIRGSFDRKML